MSLHIKKKIATHVGETEQRLAQHPRPIAKGSQRDGPKTEPGKRRNTFGQWASAESYMCLRIESLSLSEDRPSNPFIRRLEPVLHKKKRKKEKRRENENA